MSYQILASYYDSLMQEIDYSAMADFYERAFAQFGSYPNRRPALVLDLGCGSGQVTLELAKRGYDMTGVDRSPEMLCHARENAENAGKSILFLEQDMTALELYGTVGGVVCALDCINYLTDSGALSAAFERVHTYLEPGGLFIFDVNTHYKFQTEFAQNTYIYEAPGVFCTWENNFHPKTGKCDFDLTFFTQQSDGRYVRSSEYQQQRAWSDRVLTKHLNESGFAVMHIFSDTNFSPAGNEDERHYFICKRPEES